MARNRASLPEDPARRGKGTTVTGNAPNVVAMAKEAQRTAGPMPLRRHRAPVRETLPAKGAGVRGGPAIS